MCRLWVMLKGTRWNWSQERATIFLSLNHEPVNLKWDGCRIDGNGDVEVLYSFFFRYWYTGINDIGLELGGGFLVFVGGTRYCYYHRSLIISHRFQYLNIIIYDHYHHLLFDGDYDNCNNNDSMVIVIALLLNFMTSEDAYNWTWATSI